MLLWTSTVLSVGPLSDLANSDYSIWIFMIAGTNIWRKIKSM